MEDVIEMENGDMMESSKVHLNVNSYISIGAAFLIVTVIFSFAFWLNTRFGQIDIRLTEINYGFKETNSQMAMLKEKVNALESKKPTDLWTGSDMLKWTIHLQQNNQQMKVPEPKHEGNE